MKLVPSIRNAALFSVLVLCASGVFAGPLPVGEQVRGWTILSDNDKAAESIIERAPDYGINHLQLSHRIVHDLREIKEEGRQAQVNRLTWPGRYWRAGDTLLIWYNVVLQPAAKELYAGMYLFDGERYHNAEVLDENGAYVAQGAIIPLQK